MGGIQWGQGALNTNTDIIKIEGHVFATSLLLRLQKAAMGGVWLIFLHL